MSFAKIPTIHVDPKILREDPLDPYIALDRMGFHGELCGDILKDWFNQPYLSILRWAVTAASGQDVDRELKKIQQRAAKRFAIEMDRWTQFYTKNVKYREALDAIHLIRQVTDEKQAEIIAKKLTKKETTARFIATEYAHLMFKKIHKEQEELYEMKEVANLGKRQIAIESVVGMASLSQALWIDKPLYRGICCAQGDEIARQSRDFTESVTIQSDHATSFTSDFDTAQNFAKMGRIVEKAVVLAIEIPREAIVASHDVFWQLRTEKEIIVATTGTIDVEPSMMTEAQ